MFGKIEIGTNVDNSEPVYLSIDHLIAERGLIQANSGGGKSYGVRVIAEKSYGKIQQILISPKNEFRTLREKYDYILVGKNTETYDVDIEVDSKHAGKLAEKILENNVNAIIDLSAFHLDSILFVKNFIDFMNNAGEKLWHPVEVFIDEIHKFAPEKGYGEAISLNAISELASTGRDKGYCLIGATQRLSKFNNNVASELNIKFIGKCSLDTDIQRAGKEIGFKPDDYKKLRKLGAPNYHFYCYGAGLSDDVIKMKFSKAVTTHVAGWERVKNKLNPPVPSKIKLMMSRFVEIENESVKELKTKDDLEKKIVSLNIELKKALSSSNNVKVDEQLLDRYYKKGVIDGTNRLKIEWNKRVNEANNLLIKLEKNMNEVNNMILISRKKLENIPTEINTPNMVDNITEQKIFDKTYEVTQKEPDDIQNNTQLRRGALKMLKVLTQFDNYGLTKERLKTFTGISSNTTFSTYKHELLRLGWIKVKDELIYATELGMNNVRGIEPLSSDPYDLIKMWSSKFREGCSKMLNRLFEIYPNNISKEELMQQVGISSNTTFSTYKHELIRNDLIISENGFLKLNGDSFGL